MHGAGTSKSGIEERRSPPSRKEAEGKMEVWDVEPQDLVKKELRRGERSFKES